MYAPDTQRNGIALPFWNVPGGYVDDVSSLSEIPFSAATEPGNCAIIRMKEFIKEVGSYNNSFLIQHEICDRR